MNKAAFLVVLSATVCSAFSGQVRSVPPLHVEYGAKSKFAFSPCAAKIADHSLRNLVASGEKVDVAAFDGLCSDISLAWDDDSLHIALEPQGREMKGDAILSDGRRTVRAPIGGKTGNLVDIPWKKLSAEGVPPDGLTFAADLEWSGLDVAALRAMPNDVRRAYVHTSLAAHTDKEEAFRENACLPRPDMWGKIKFGDDCAVGTRKVDGDLGDWPVDKYSKSVMLPQLIGDRYAAAFQTAFDDDFLYVAARISHPDGRPTNSALAETGAGYRGGDALQIRFSTDGKTPCSLCAWMSPTGPALTVDTRNPGERDLLKRGALLALGRAKDCATMEIALPWSVLGAKAKHGDEWRMTYQPWWNGMSKRFTFFAPLVLERPPAKTVTAEVPKAGSVSLGVFDMAGRLVKTILKSDWREAGRIVEPWDLKDQWGKSVTPGEYVVKGLVTDGVNAEYLHSLLNPGNPSWPTVDGRGDWLSDEAPPQGMATDGEIVFVAAPGSEKGFAVMAIRKDGKRLWGVGEQFYPRCVSLSYLDGVLYSLWSGPIKDASAAANGSKAGAMGRAVVIAYDAKTGRRVGFSAKDARTELGPRWPYREQASNLYDLIAEKSFSPAVYIGQPRYWDQDVGETDNAIGFAALPGIFAVSKFYDNAVELYDAAALEKICEIAIDSPAGLCRIGDRELLAVSGNRIVKVVLSGKKAKVANLISEGLAAPVAVTADKAGNIYVSDWAGDMCVKKFSPEGKPIGIIGKRGGRPWAGEFEKDGMLLPHGLAATDDGMLFVAEADMIPKRISAWDASSGKFLRHWTGPTPYGGMSGFLADPDEPGFFRAAGCRYSWDEKSGAWDVVSTELRRMSHDQPFMPNGASCMSGGSRIVKRGGDVFIAVGRRNQTVWLRKTGDTLTPCAAVGGLHSMTTDDGTGLTCWDSDIGRHLYRNRRPQCFKGHSGKRGRAGDNYSWSDLNGDGLVQPDEMTWVETLTRGDSLDKLADGKLQCEFYNGWGAIPASDGTLHFAGFAKDGDCIWRLKCERWTRYGPVYDIRKARPIHREPGRGVQYMGVWTDDAGSVIAAGAMKNIRNLKSRAAISSFAQDGSVKWEFAAPDGKGEKNVAASGVNGEWNIPGIGRIFCTWNWWWNFRPYFFTEDGLYVGTFGKETTLGPEALWGESATYFFQKKDGTPCLVNGANQGAHVFAVRGLNDARRFEGRVVVTSEEIDKAGKAVKTNAPSRVDDMPKSVISLDGVPFRVDGGRGRGFTSSVVLDRVDGKIAFNVDVDDPSPLVQPGTDYSTLFVTGDCVDFMFACDPSAPKNRRTAAFGDKRLLFSEIEGKGVAVLFEPITRPRAERPKMLMAAAIDRITVLDDAKVKFVRRNGGYTLKAEVPVSSIGIDALLAGNDAASIRGDVGVVFSGPAGGRELRLYRYNADTSMTSDLTTEATLQPREWGEMILPQGANLVRDPSFEEGGAWEFKIVPAGDIAEYVDVAYTGMKSLYMETRSHISVGQTVKLPGDCGGKIARLRLVMRSKGLKPQERRKVGKPGAWMSALAFCRNAKNRILSTEGLSVFDSDSSGWVGLKRRHKGDRPGPVDRVDFLIPEGTDNIRIDFKTTTRGLDVPACVWIDSVELSIADPDGAK